MLQWQEGAEDKRERLLSLTDKGKEYVEPLLQNMQSFNDKVFIAFGEKRAARLFADLDVLAELMTQAIHTKQGD